MAAIKISLEILWKWGFWQWWFKCSAISTSLYSLVVFIFCLYPACKYQSCIKKAVTKKMRIYLYAAARWNLLKCALWCYISIRSKCVTMCCNSFASCQALWKKEKWNIFFPLSAETHARSCKTNSDSVMLKVICHVLCSPCGRLSGLGGAGCSELNHQVITVLCGPCRQQIRLRGSMICSWKSTPLKSKSILSERLPKDKVCCIIKKNTVVFLCVCVDLAPVFECVFCVLTSC